MIFVPYYLFLAKITITLFRQLGHQRYVITLCAEQFLMAILSRFLCFRWSKCPWNWRLKCQCNLALWAEVSRYLKDIIAYWIICTTATRTDFTRHHQSEYTWASSRLCSPATGLSLQQLVQTKITEHVKLSINAHVLQQSIGDREFPFIRGQ